MTNRLSNVLLLLVTILFVFAVGEATLRILGIDAPWNTKEECDRKFSSLVQEKNLSEGFGNESRFDYHSTLGFTNRKGYTTIRKGNSQQPVKELLPWSTSTGFYHVNPQGLRMLREAAIIRPLPQRIALLGDSFTFGAAEETKYIFPTLLEDLLVTADVLNFGVEGYSFSQMVLRYLLEAKNYSPSHAVFVIYIDDIRRNAQLCGSLWYTPQLIFGESLRVQPVPSPKDISGWKPPKLRSYFLSWIHSVVEEKGQNRREYDEGFLISRKLIRLLKDDTDTSSFFVILGGIKPSSIEKEQISRLEQMLKEEGFHYLNVDSALQTVPEEWRRRFYHNHISIFGHPLLATFLAEDLNQLFDLPITKDRFILSVREGERYFLTYPNMTSVYLGKLPSKSN